MRCPNLEIIANFGVRFTTASNALHAGKSGVMVTNTPDVADRRGGCRHGDRASPQCRARTSTGRNEWLRQGRWVKDGPYRLTPGTLRGRKVGIFGLGRIGQAVRPPHRGPSACRSPKSPNRRQVEGVRLRLNYGGQSLVELSPQCRHAD